MIGENEFDRLLTSWLEAEGPQDVPVHVVEGALATARAQGQAGGWVDALRGRRWPVDPGGIWSPARRRLLTLAMVALATVAVVGVVVLAGAAILDRISTSPMPSASPDPSVAPAAGGRFSPTGKMAVPRQYPTLVKLLDGRVLILGGDGDEGPVTEVEIYDPTTGTFGVAGALPTREVGYSATVLDDGRVLIAGGHQRATGTPSDTPGPVSTPVPALTAWLYDPTTGALAPTGQMNAGRSGHGALKLSDGRVLVVDDGGGAEVYDLRTGTWSTLPDGPEARRGSVDGMVLLGDGRVLRLGGYESAVLDPATGSWTKTGPSLVRPGGGWTLAPMPDGGALLAGGTDFGGGRLQPDAERYDPIANVFRPTGSMAVAHPFATAVALHDGRALILSVSDRGADPAEVYDPVSETFSIVDEPGGPIVPQAAVLLDDGRVLIVQDGVLENLILELDPAEAR